MSIIVDGLRTLSLSTTRFFSGRFVKPISRAATALAVLLFFAFVGRHAVPGALAGISPTPSSAPPVATAVSAIPEPSHPPPPPQPSVGGISSPPIASAVESATTSRGRASSSDPVVLNTASSDELRRLPGIGPKRADAIAALRARLGRFRAIEDLLKVKGVGRAMLKRLRPLVRLDPAPADSDH
jgi:competence protein ComEA